MLKRSTSKMRNSKCNKILVSVNVVGSTGPIRFVANEDDLVCEVMKTTLISYARLARLPTLGTNVDNFVLYCVNDGMDALSLREAIGAKQVRHFLLCKKEGTSHASLPKENGKNNWKTWLTKSLHTTYNIVAR
ncbi:hypothetical protein SDJN02_00342, partial [Cucurbita argyrosperma subsp. argyrosperma]